jgi:Na+/H+ antiporter NhaD/arsenite permease-like protein
VEFILFALTLIGVAIFHKHTMYVALAGLFSILVFKYIVFSDFSFYLHVVGSTGVEGEWGTLVNLTGLLLGFAILSRVFELSGVPDKLPQYLPGDWKGGLILLLMIMILSTFLDNIAAALIGGSMALVVFKGRVHIGYLAAIVAASNAGGAGSVLGDTTTTLMWIDGVSPVDVLHGFIASFAAFAVFGVFASIQQQKYQPIQIGATEGVKVDVGLLIIVIGILAGAIASNFLVSMPALGVWVAILVGAIFRKLPWKEVPHAITGTIFLLSLVTCASLMPVEELPPASWESSLVLGFVSSVFDNIPLTKLCLEQGGYDWGLLAYAVGFGGSMIWFGSSAGVALSNKFHEAKSVIRYLRHGWHVTLAYVIGFFVLLGVLGFHPGEKRGMNTREKAEVQMVQPGKESEK